MEPNSFLERFLVDGLFIGFAAVLLVGAFFTMFNGALTRFRDGSK